MEEKERYKLESYNEAFCQIHDTESGEWYLRKDLVTDLLNQQDKRIKELEEKYQDLKEDNDATTESLYACRTYLDKNTSKMWELEKENQQLKQSQKQLAVEELEKLKDFFLEPSRDEEMDTDFLITKDAGSIADYVLDRIKELKGEE